MLARHDGDEGLLVLVVLDDSGRGERLAASLAELDDITVVMWEDIGSGDHAAVAVVSDIATAKSLPIGTPVILLSDPGSEVITHSSIAAALRADAAPALIAAAARLAAAGYRITGGAVDAFDRSPSGAAGEPDGNEVSLPIHLSPREAEVLALLAEGAPNKVIARRLDISVHTVKFHVAAILVKLGAANRTDAIATAMRQGLVLV